MSEQRVTDVDALDKWLRRFVPAAAEHLHDVNGHRTFEPNGPGMFRDCQHGDCVDARRFAAVNRADEGDARLRAAREEIERLIERDRQYGGGGSTLHGLRLARNAIDGHTRLRDEAAALASSDRADPAPAALDPTGRGLRPILTSLLSTMRGISTDRTVTTLSAARVVAAAAAVRAEVALAALAASLPVAPDEPEGGR